MPVSVESTNFEDLDASLNGVEFESDNEDLSTDANDFDLLFNDYWYGKQLLGFHVATAVFRKNRNSPFAENLDAIYEEELHKFPYEGCLQKMKKTLRLNDEEIGSDDSPYKALLTLIGTTYRDGDDTVQAKVDGVIENFCSKRNDSSTSPRDHAALPNRTANARPPPAAEDEQLPRYTSRLKEYFETSGEKPEYDEEQIQEYPPCFKMVVRVQDMEFSGQGARKQIARHHASRAACQALGIRLK